MAPFSRNQFIASAAGTLEVMEALGSGSPSKSLAELVRLTGKPKGTVHRMVSTLVNTGFASYSKETCTYALTLKAWRIGSAALQNFDLASAAKPALERLSAETGETVHLSVLEPTGDIVYVAKVASPKSIGVQTRLGQLSPSWCTATGRALLAYHHEIAERVLEGNLERRTPHTTTDPQELRHILQKTRADGYVLARAENVAEMGGIASPIRDHSGEVIASVGVAMPIFRMSQHSIKSIVPLVKQAAADISQRMGFSGKTPIKNWDGTPGQVQQFIA